MDIRRIIESQYQAALSMLQDAIEKCPDSMWNGQERNRSWHIAYHILFSTHMYLQDSEQHFTNWFKAWPKCRADYQFFGAVPWPPHYVPKIDQPYTKAEILEYVDICREVVREKVSFLDLDAASGFFWLPLNKTELQFYSIRHIQHHTGQLSDRLRAYGNIGVDWVGAKAD